MFTQCINIHGVTSIDIGAIQSKKNNRRKKPYQTLQITVICGNTHKAIILCSDEETMDINKR